MKAIDWSQALAWRLQRHQLEPVGTESLEGVVGRLIGVRASDEFAAELAIRTRRKQSAEGEVNDALADGRIVKTFTFRGATHLMTPAMAGVHLALRASARMWELPSWQSYYGLAPSDWPAFREVVLNALADGPMTVSELVSAIAEHPRYRQLGSVLAGNPWSVVKALAWQGDLSFGPTRGRATLQRMDGNPHWTGLPDMDVAGPRAVEAYLAAYGPAVPAKLQYWLGQGLGAGGKHVRSWIASLGDRLAEVEVDGAPNLVMREDLPDLVDAKATPTVRLLPAYDQWLMGPGTADASIVPVSRRSLVSGGANMVILGGVVSGTWSLGDKGLVIDWFAEAGPPPQDELDVEVGRLGAILGQSPVASIRTA